MLMMQTDGCFVPSTRGINDHIKIIKFTKLHVGLEAADLLFILCYYFMSLLNSDNGLFDPLRAAVYILSLSPDHYQQQQRSAAGPAAGGLHQQGGALHRRHGRDLRHSPGGEADPHAGETQRREFVHSDSFTSSRFASLSHFHTEQSRLAQF